MALPHHRTHTALAPALRKLSATGLAVLAALGSILPAGAAAPVIGGLAPHASLPPRLAGRVLASELGCAACHTSGDLSLAPKPGPDLSEAGTRIKPAHLRRFIANPSATKPGTTMPDVLAHLPEAAREGAALALTLYLASLGGPLPHSAAPDVEAIARGKALYHSVGCVACHAPEDVPDASSVPLGPIGEKYSVASLAAFLENPLRARPGGRMPDSRLERAEATDIASYLVRDYSVAPPAGTPIAPDASLVERGRTLFTEHRCNTCHAVGGRQAAPTLVALEKARLDRGCLGEAPGAWPRYPLSTEQRNAIKSALATGNDATTTKDQIDLSLARLNCIACHQRDAIGGVATNRQAHFTGTDENLGEQGRLPPPLTGVGAKLKQAWLREVIADGASARPYLHTRMPAFGAAHGEAIAGMLKQQDSLPAAEFERVSRADKPREAGRDLAGSKGFNCIACHTFRERSASPLRALDLTTMAARLEENWFHHYMINPARFSPQTIMPGFWPDGKSPLPEVLGGNPGRQRDALWNYLAQGPEAGEPRGLVLEPLVVEVKQEAVIVRRAFPGIGKRGLGVGYPGGINLSFDAAQMRLASVWSGGFIEASGLWRGQGAGQARILGKDTVTFPAGPAFAVLAAPDAAWPVPDPTPRPSPFSFKGYTLDDRQRPTLRYVVDGFAVEDFFIERPDAAGKFHLERTLKFPADPPAGLHFRIATDKAIEPRGANEFAVGGRLVVRLSAPGTVRRTGDAMELLLPVSGSELKLEYHPVHKP